MASPRGRATLAALVGAAAVLALVALVVIELLPVWGARPLPMAQSAPSAAVAVDAADEPRPQLRGHILDADGNAVPGAHVRVLEQSRVVAESPADRSGAFSFARLSGRIRLEADHDPEGEVRSAELVVTDDTAMDLTLVLSAASVRGVVVDAEDGHPVAGATVSPDGMPWTVASATADASGGFRLTVVPFEATALVAVANGYRSGRASLGPREDQPEPVLRIALRRGDPVEGDVLDPDGKPLRAQVVACEGQPAEARTESADDGRFKLPPSAVGCDAIALHEDMAPSDPVHVEDRRRTTLRLGAGGSIAGSVVDERGAAVEAFTVGVESFAGPHGAAVHVKPTSFQGGDFRLEHLIPGSYVLTASTPGRPPARSDPVDVRAGALTDGVRIVLAPGGVVVGRVFDERSAALEGVDLRFDLVSSVAGSDANAKTDSAGRYRLEGAPQGPFTIRAQKEGFRLKLLSGLFLESGRTLTKDIVLTSFDGGQGLEFGGIGANLTVSGNGIVFAAVFPGEPADRAGVRQGDRLARVDGEDASGMSLQDAIQRLRGEAGTSVGVSVQRSGTVIDLIVVRGSIVR